MVVSTHKTLQFYREKEVTVYYKVIGEAVVLLTVKARYGQSFQKG